METVERAVQTAPQGFRGEAQALLRLGAPIMATQACIMGMGFLDTAMAGRYGAVDLAGVTLAGTILWPVFLLMTGVTMAVMPIVSQLVGARRTTECGEVIRHGVWVALGGSLVTIVIIRSAGPLFTLMNADPEVVSIATGYLQAASWGMPGAMAYVVLRQSSEGLGQTRPPMIIAVLALALNAPLNYVLIYGALGMPALGGVGCGWATSAVMWFELGLMLLVTRRPYFRATGFLGRAAQPSNEPGLAASNGPLRPTGLSPRLSPNRLAKAFSVWLEWRWDTTLRILKLGLPIGCTIFLEAAIFAAVSVLIAGHGVTALAGHSIAANLNWGTYVIPMCLGSAAAIRVGFHVGGGNLVGARRVSAAAFRLSLAYALVVSVVLIGLRFHLVGIYTTDAEVIAVAANLLIFIAVYQIFDDTNATMVGALRGYKDTRVPMLISLVGYWIIALPLGVALAKGWLGLPAVGVYGYWSGLTLGLFLVAACMAVRLRRTSRDLERIDQLALG